MVGSLVPCHGGWQLEWRSSGQEKAPQVGLASAPARRSGLSSRHDPSDDQVSFVVDFSIPLSRRGAEAYIVGVVGHPYLTTLVPLWLIMSSYLSTTPVVLTVKHAFAGRPYDRWRPHTCIRPTSRIGSTTSTGQLSEGAKT
ncbi:hypothetical protein BHE74_00028591 [Ensete ventricosum]|nr:hypothetical protein BHE74_00028591 [Ensete ventricosum]RZR95002.1 hypothetical protein BHM03_00023786 [Ensete ventricosum]